MLRIWDVFLLEGYKIVFRIALTVLKASREQILGMEFEALMDFLKHGEAFRQILQEPDDLMRAAFEIPLTRAHLQQLRDEYPIGDITRKR